MEWTTAQKKGSFVNVPKFPNIFFFLFSKTKIFVQALKFVIVFEKMREMEEKIGRSIFFETQTEAVQL